MSFSFFLGGGGGGGGKGYVIFSALCIVELCQVCISLISIARSV